MCEDVKEKKTPIAVIIEEKDEPICTPSPKLKSRKFSIKEMEMKTEIMEHSVYWSHVTIFRLENEQDSGSNKPMKLILEK